MMEINYEAQSVVEPDEITYMPIDDGLADVWIRKAIHEEEVHTEEYEGIMWFWRETMSELISHTKTSLLIKTSIFSIPRSTSHTHRRQSMRGYR